MQDQGNLPEYLVCPVVFQDGSRHEYRVPVIRIQTYTLEEIHEKHLCVLIPFLPLRFRKELSRRHAEISKDQLTDFYEQIILILNQEVAEGYLTENKRKAILSLLSKSMIRVFYKDKKLLEEVLRLTEPVLELEFEKVERLERELVEQREAFEKQRGGLEKEIEFLQEELSRYREKEGKS